jgi:hypothetical protein
LRWNLSVCAATCPTGRDIARLHDEDFTKCAAAPIY